MTTPNPSEKEMERQLEEIVSIRKTLSYATCDSPTRLALECCETILRRLIEGK